MLAETHTLSLTGGELPDGTLAKHMIEVSLSYLAGAVHDIIFVTRGKTGHGMDLLFQDLGIQLSRLIQGRDAAEPAAEPEQEELAI
jgi:hypothetical protein